MKRYDLVATADAIQFEDELWNRYSIAAQRDGRRVYVREIDEDEADELAEEFFVTGERDGDADRGL